MSNGAPPVSVGALPSPSPGVAPFIVRINRFWSPILALEGCGNGPHVPAGPGPRGHGASGVVSYQMFIPGSAINGSCPAAAFAPYNRRVEFTNNGTFALSVNGTHNGVTGTIAPQLVPNDSAFVSLTWSCYANIIGTTIRDRSSTLFGVIGE